MAKKYKQTKKYTKQYYSQENTEDSPPFQEMMNTPYDLNDIQPRSIKVWNWNEIGFYTNGKW